MAERPVECSHCKKSIKVTYKEIVTDSIVCTEMCEDCPVLQKKLHGEVSPAKEGNAPVEEAADLYCDNCKTSLEAVKMGTPLGCGECYSVFSDLLLNELTASEKVPLYLRKALSATKSQPAHIGKTPHKPLTIPSSTRLTAFNEALNEALKIENYEQAAWLRDQIKALTEKSNEGKE